MIGSSLVAHNCIEFDYCLEAAIDSVLGVADELRIIDAASTDGTFEYLEARAASDSRVTIQREAWIPNTAGRWLAELQNAARINIKSDYHFYVQADEVLHEDSYPVIREFAADGRCFSCPRLNFMRDNWHLVPHGAFFAHLVTRFGPTGAIVGGDAESLEPSFVNGPDTDAIQIFHYGLLRKAEAFFAKSKPMHIAYGGGLNSTLERAEREKLFWPDEFFKPEQLGVFSGSHPKPAHKWLVDHGYAVEKL